jgi:general secretion pathway protein D
MLTIIPLVGCDNNVPFWGGQVNNVWTTDDGTGTTDDGTGTTDDGSGTTGEISDLQVAVEVRFVSVKDDFFERIGVDFDTEFDFQPTTIPNAKFQPEENNDTDVAFTREFIAGSNQIDSSQEPFVIDAIAPDFDITGFPSLVGTLIDNLQVNSLISAFENDQSARSLSAPKLVTLNNQRAAIAIKNEIRFRDDMNTTFINKADSIDTLINPYTTGPGLQITPTVSADRRFINIIIIPILFAQFNTPDVTGNRFLVQRIEVQTMVSIPDGGTLLLGGIKRVGEANQNGTLPVLGNLPIIGRLFENRTAVTEQEELLVMVTPRIIIQEE